MVPRMDVHSMNQGIAVAPVANNRSLHACNDLRLPNNFLQLSTLERDFAHQAIGKLFCPYREPASSSQLNTSPTRIHRAEFGSLTLFMLSYGRPIVIEPVHFGSSLFLTTTLCGRVQIDANGVAYQCIPGATVLTAAEDHPCFRYDASAEALKLHLDRTRLEALCWQTMGIRGREPLRFSAPLHDARFLDRWLALLAFLVSTVESDRNWTGRERFISTIEETVMLTLLNGQPHNYSDRLANCSYAIAPRQWRRAIAFMEANISRAITLADIASAAGCSIRSLTRAFRAYGDTSPMRHLLELRLQRVRADFKSLDGMERSITTAALHWGFRHLGEFNRHYHQCFGETPSQTRARALRLQRAPQSAKPQSCSV